MIHAVVFVTCLLVTGTVGAGVISTHVLDTCHGAPVADMQVTLHQQQDEQNWTHIYTGVTNTDGRVSDMLNGSALQLGIYMLSFDTTSYCSNKSCFFKDPKLTFVVMDTAQKYHVPLLLSPYSFSSYRGS